MDLLVFLLTQSLAVTGQPGPAVASSTGPIRAAPVLAFPGAEGAGALATGGRGGRVIKVTSLADSGPGTLREAVELECPRTVIFDTSGTIRLESPLVIRSGRITIAGQTARAGGITLRDQPLVVRADDVVIRFLRSRLGDESRVEADAVSIVSGRRILLDHVSASWSVDETLSAGRPTADPAGGVDSLTVQWSIISESLNRSAHGKGEHGYGSLVRAGFGARLSFHHNLWAHHRARMPRPGNYNGPEIDPIGPLMEFRSNVFYNWAGSRAGYNADEATHIAYNFIDNAYVAGPNSRGTVAFEDSNRLARAFFSGNSMNGTVPADPWSLVTGVNVVENRSVQPIAVAQVRSEPAAASFERVLALAGASHARDSVDTRIVETVRARSGAIIDSQDDVGGWPELSPGEAWIDSDEDGIPDQWETARGLDAHDASDGNGDRDNDGWTNLEEWLAELAG